MSGVVSKIWSISRAVASDQHFRRKAMLAVLSCALAQVFIGAVFLWDFFDRQPLVFAVYWLACGWLVLTAVFLAIYDMLCVLRTARVARRSEQKRIFTDLP
jgi:membrane protein implicated in regulation of membrane protease activity